jgi:hypothetical protein
VWLVWRRANAPKLRVVAVAIGGGALSTQIWNLAQYIDAGRISSADDVYANLLATVIGGLCFTGFSGTHPVFPFLSIGERPIPMALFASSAG